MNKEKLIKVGIAMYLAIAVYTFGYYCAHPNIECTAVAVVVEDQESPKPICTKMHGLEPAASMFWPFYWSAVAQGAKP